MNGISRIFGLINHILLLSGCSVKQGSYVCATNVTDWVYEDDPVWDKRKQSHMNILYLSNYKTNGEPKPASESRKNPTDVRRDRPSFPSTSLATYIRSKFRFRKHTVSSSVFSRAGNAPSTNNSFLSRYVRSSDGTALFRRVPTPGTLSMSRNARYSNDIILPRRARSSDVIAQTGNVRFADLMNCGNDEFQCFYDGACISKLAICDRNTDCLEYGDDELDCPRMDCPAGAFQCKSGECLSYIHRCDGFGKCRDRSDEVGCETSTCPPHFYRCHNGQCIQLKKRCDGNNIIINEIIDSTSKTNLNETAIRETYLSRYSNGSLVYSDCFDGSDELNCENYSCPGDHFKCKNGQCASLSARCDAIYPDERIWRGSMVQCNDGSDEEDCDQSECGDYFRCSDGRCLHPSGRCDEVAHCNDAGDEENCHLNNANCPLHSFSCRPGHCVPYLYRCSGQNYIDNNINNHCPDGDDLNKYCPLSKCPRGYYRCHSGQCLRNNICDKQDNAIFCNQQTDPTDHCGRTDCPRDYFRCTDGHCLHHVSVCDNVPDCPGEEDETHCGRSECREDQVDCGDGNCIPIALKCDGYNHCAKGQDETNCDVFNRIIHSTISYSCKINFSFPVVTHYVMGTCSFAYLEGCICTNGMVNCSSSTFTFTGPNANLATWPFQEVVWGIYFPLQYWAIDLVKVYGIVLSNSLLTKVPVGALRLTPYLQILDLSRNLLTELRYGDFNGLYRLSVIDVSHNQIHTIDDFTFKGLRVLHMNLENNFIEHFGLDLFGGLAVDGTIRTDARKFCCIKPSYLPEQNCFPGADLFSSCDDLMGHMQFRAMLWVIGLFACLGNVVVAVRRFLNSRGKNRTRYGFFVINLHISDCLMGIYLLVIAFADVHFRGRYMYEDANWRGGVMCTSAGIISLISNESSPMFDLFITVDRYFGVKYPFGTKRLTYRTSIALATFAWGLSVFLAIVPLMFTGFFKGEFYGSSVVCLAIPLSTQLMAGWQYAVAVYSLLNSLVFICILIGQAAIMHEIYLAKSNTHAQSQINEIKVAKSLMFIVLTDFLCWCPVCILTTLSLIGVNMPLEMYSWVLVLILPINAALNPIFYTLMMRQ